MGAARWLESVRASLEPLLALVLATLVTLVLTLPLLPEGVDVEALLRESPGAIPYLLAIQAAVFLLAGGLLIRYRVRSRPARPVALWRAVLAGIGAGGVALLLSTVLSHLLEAFGFPVEEQAWLQELFRRPETVLRIAPWIVLVGPLAEEVFFRGYAYRFIAERAGVPVGLVVSSLLFAAIHTNLSGFFVYLAIGAVLAGVYERTARLAAAFTGHVVVNACVLTFGVLVGRI
jgi:membrane protease YdiL (CAAX protease family)